MRKIARKTTSLTLVLMLLLSAMSVAAFAFNEVQPCAVCTHPNLMATWFSEARQYNDECHMEVDFCLYTCPDCIYSNKVVEGTRMKAHVFDDDVCLFCNYQR